MASYVYLITNQITNKHYIGKTNNKNLRWSQHKSKAKSENSYFYNSLKSNDADKGNPVGVKIFIQNI